MTADEILRRSTALHRPRHRGRRLLLIAAIVATALFVLSTIFSFGIATHHQPSLGWHSSRAGLGIVQVFFGHGRVQLLIDIAPIEARSAHQPRGWYAGADFNPSFTFNVHHRNDWTDYLGAGAFVSAGGTYFGCGVSGLYVCAALWTLTWWFARRARRVGVRCPTCDYSLAGSPGVCPECGRPQSVTP